VTNAFERVYFSSSTRTIHALLHERVSAHMQANPKNGIIIIMVSWRGIASKKTGGHLERRPEAAATSCQCTLLQQSNGLKPKQKSKKGK